MLMVRSSRTMVRVLVWWCVTTTDLCSLRPDQGSNIGIRGGSSWRPCFLSSDLSPLRCLILRGSLLRGIARMSLTFADSRFKSRLGLILHLWHMSYPFLQSSTMFYSAISFGRPTDWTFLC
ncbi:hypothetical protein KSP40_PGU017085 [Platanthera guangdongensis]|uniref:Secreted protein n=1 Tax=Platanthera guangdongensis TaxID=2320717 RepID=A0ABR2LSD2_9ASPA